MRECKTATGKKLPRLDQTKMSNLKDFKKTKLDFVFCFLMDNNFFANKNSFKLSIWNEFHILHRHQVVFKCTPGNQGCLERLGRCSVRGENLKRRCALTEKIQLRC